MKGQEQLFSSANDEYGTPAWLFNQLNAIYNFTLDPCATPQNTKVKSKFYTKADNGLTKSWKGEKVFVNPPYSKIKDWMNKCLTEFLTNNILIVALVPNRSDTKWFHESVAGYASVNVIEGRIKFDGATAGAPFPSIIVTYMPRIIRP